MFIDTTDRTIKLVMKTEHVSIISRIALRS